MKDNIINELTFVLCEGPHDVAFLSRLINECGCEDKTRKKISSYPDIIKNYIITTANKFDYLPDGQMFQRPDLPSAICADTNDDWFVFYSMNGDSNSSFAKKIIHVFQNLQNNDFEDEETFMPKFKMSLLFFFDADDSLENRLNVFNREYKEELPCFVEELENMKINKSSNVDNFDSIGLYIFCDDNGVGTLENILIPFIEEGNSQIFESADKFLKEYSSHTFPSSDYSKAKIGIVGQAKLNKPGASNVIIIRDIEYISKEKIESNQIVKEIVQFFGIE